MGKRRGKQAGDAVGVYDKVLQDTCRRRAREAKKWQFSLHRSVSVKAVASGTFNLPLLGFLSPQLLVHLTDLWIKICITLSREYSPEANSCLTGVLGPEVPLRIQFSLF